jgi:hypothetical protein
MISPKFAHILRTFGTSALRHIHESLHIQDRITAMIHKEKLLRYPHCVTLAGIWREYVVDQAKPSDEQWIRDVHFFDEDRKHFLIIFCTYEQAKLFQKVQFLEMDLAFKIVQGKTKVFLLSSFDEEAKCMFSTYAFYKKILTNPEASLPMRMPF